ncbi:MAG: TlpA disulfide reductase family protein [Vicingaceae bacterium]|nr:TlpA disulfide reductase family protein [Vicingaceae bacterium]
MMKFKQILTALIVALIAFACGNSTENIEEVKPSFTIDAKIDSLTSQTAYLAQFKDGGFVNTDSATIENGMFSFKGSVESPNVQYILFNDSKDRIVVFLENSEISISGTNLQQENLSVIGSDLNTKLEKFIVNVKSYEEKLKSVVEEYYAAEASGDESLLIEIDQKYKEQDSLRKSFVEAYIHDNLNSVIAPYLSLRYKMDDDVSELEELYNSFSPEIANSEYVKLIGERIALKKGTQVGQPAPLFSMNDKDGNPIALESFKGKYVLIDFWASWCAPCRAENPNVVAAYNKYHDKGFEIFGVSFDDNKDKWLKAVEADNLAWSHVSDLKGWGNAAGQLYGVRGIPHSVLVDKEGVIIAKDLRGEELQDRLAEIFAGV